MLPQLSGPQEQAQRDADREQRAKQSREQTKLDTEFVMSDARGRRLLASLLTDAGIFRSVMAPDALHMAFNEGRRQAGLALMDRLTRDTPDLYFLMEKERVNG